MEHGYCCEQWGHPARAPQGNHVVHVSTDSCPLLVEGHLCEYEIPLPYSRSYPWAEQAPVGQRKPEQRREAGRVLRNCPQQLLVSSGMPEGLWDGVSGGLLHLPVPPLL